jgi:protein-tyrosine phosphatase
MRKVFWLRPHVIGGRSGPNKDFWNPGELARGGFGAIISVNDGELVHPEALSAVGIDYKCVPLSDSAPPQPGDLERCAAALPQALAFALQSIESGRSVLVHCHSGKDRTGMFLSYFLCETEGLPAAEAIEEVKRVRPIALSAEGWEPFTLRVLAAVAAEYRD